MVNSFKDPVQTLLRSASPTKNDGLISADQSLKYSLSCNLQPGAHLDHVEQQDRGNLGPCGAEPPACYGPSVNSGLLTKGEGNIS